MRAGAMEGEMDLSLAGGEVRARIKGVEGGDAYVRLSAAQAREWARCLIIAAQKTDGQCLRLAGFDHGSVPVIFPDN